MTAKNTSLPLVSVVVPVYDPGEYFAPFLASLQAQSWQSWQAILVDDGSTDGSAEAADAIAKADSRFTVLHQANQGASAARAAGAAHAGGDFLICVDSDDLLHPDLLQTLANGCLQHHAQLAFCRFAPFAGTCPADAAATREGTVMPGQQAREMLLHDQRLDYALSNKLFAKGLLTPEMLQAPFRYNEDLLASWHAFAGVDTAVFFDFDGYHCRQHAASTSHKGITQQFLADQYAVARQILYEAQGTPMQQSAEAFYYEKLLYLESMMLRASRSIPFKALYEPIRGELKSGFSRALRNADLPFGMKPCAVLSRCFPWVWHLACRTLLRDKR